MGHSTNTILHLLAAAVEGDIPFTLDDIDRLSRNVPHLCKVVPATPQYHMEDMHRAGGVLVILAEINRAGLLHADSPHVLDKTIGEVIAQWDITNPANEHALQFYKAGPAGIRTTKAFSQNCRYPTADTDRENGCIRNRANTFSEEGGLAVLFGNNALNGCIVKTAVWTSLSISLLAERIYLKAKMRQ
jgi:dihydroxy-acid dehydratase